VAADAGANGPAGPVTGAAFGLDVGHPPAVAPHPHDTLQPSQLDRPLLLGQRPPGKPVPERRDGAEYAAWSGVHGLSSLLLDGPLHGLPEPEIERAIGTVLGAISRGLT